MGCGASRAKDQTDSGALAGSGATGYVADNLIGKHNWMASSYGQTWKPVRRKIFVSYHHRGDQYYYDEFSRAFHNDLEVITDNSLERRIDSADHGYIMRRIRDFHLHGSSCTIVLCGADTWRRKYVDWEIRASLDQAMGLVGVWLPSLPLNGEGTDKPTRLQDNIDSGYAVWTKLADLLTDHGALTRAVETALARPRDRIVNVRAMMGRNL